MELVRRSLEPPKTKIALFQPEKQREKRGGEINISPNPLLTLDAGYPPFRGNGLGICMYL